MRAAENILGTAVRRDWTPSCTSPATWRSFRPLQGAVLTPDSPVKRPRGTYSRSKAESERIARGYQEQGAPVVIVYPGGVIGPDDPYLGDSNRALVEFAKSGGGHARRLAVG